MKTAGWLYIEYLSEKRTVYALGIFSLVVRFSDSADSTQLLILSEKRTRKHRYTVRKTDSQMILRAVRNWPN